MNCSDCVNCLIRERNDGEVMRVCCLDGRVLGVIVRCNMFFERVVEDEEKKFVEVVEEEKAIEIVKKRGRPKKEMGLK